LTQHRRQYAADVAVVASDEYAHGKAPGGGLANGRGVYGGARTPLGECRTSYSAVYARPPGAASFAACEMGVACACPRGTHTRHCVGGFLGGRMADVSCRLCGASLTETFVDLGMSPLCESYLPAQRLDSPETFYPLHVRICSECLLVQLPAYVAGEDIFSDY